ncbi:unnamed protein product [Caenorhabditis brenneri]
MLLLISFLSFFLNVDCIIYEDEDFSLEAPFKFQWIKYIDMKKTNYVSSYKYINVLTGEQDYEGAQCIAPSGRYVGNGPISRIPPGTIFFDYDFNWKCTESRENKEKLSLEPVSCVYYEKDAKKPTEVKPGEWKMAENGYVKYFCDNWNGGMKRVAEFVPGCYHKGKIYAVNEKWTEKNHGDKNSSHSVWMTCHRAQSGYYEKKLIGCIVKKMIFGDFTVIDGNETYGVGVQEYDKTYSLTEVEVEWDETMKGQRHWRCEETEPGQVTFREVTQEEIGCTYKNQFHQFGSYWEDHEMGAGLICVQGNKVEKTRCLVNGKEYNAYNDEFQLTNGCTFICNKQKNIYKCPDQLTFLELVKTATTKVPTTMRSELGF